MKLNELSNRKMSGGLWTRSILCYAGNDYFLECEVVRTAFSNRTVYADSLLSYARCYVRQFIVETGCLSFPAPENCQSGITYTIFNSIFGAYGIAPGRLVVEVFIDAYIIYYESNTSDGDLFHCTVYKQKFEYSDGQVVFGDFRDDFLSETIVFD